MAITQNQPKDSDQDEEESVQEENLENQNAKISMLSYSMNPAGI
jgi:hypothetical protein